MAGRIACARVKARLRASWLIDAVNAGVPWLVIAGMALDGWVIIDMDATLITATPRSGGRLRPCICQRDDLIRRTIQLSPSGQFFTLDKPGRAPTGDSTDLPISCGGFALVPASA